MYTKVNCKYIVEHNREVRTGSHMGESGTPALMGALKSEKTMEKERSNQIRSSGENGAMLGGRTAVVRNPSRANWDSE